MFDTRKTSLHIAKKKKKVPNRIESYLDLILLFPLTHNLLTQCETGACLVEHYVVLLRGIEERHKDPLQL